MKRVGMMLLVAALALPVVAMAQPDGPEGGPPQGPPPGFSQQERTRMIENRVKQLERNLKLSEAQKKSIQAILVDEEAAISKLHEQMRANFEKEQASDEASNDRAQSDDKKSSDKKKARRGRPEGEGFTQMREEMKAIRDEHNAKIRETLTTEQQKKFDELLKKRSHREEMGAPGGAPPEGGGPGGDGPGGDGPGGAPPDGGGGPM